MVQSPAEKSELIRGVFMVATIFYYIALIFLTIPSWGFVDANALLPKIASLQPIIYFQTLYPVIWYTSTVTALLDGIFGCYTV